MAQLIVRPIADLALGSSNMYASGTAAYSMINEVVADGTTTYVGSSTAGQMFVDLCTAVDSSKIQTINSLTVVINCLSSTGTSSIVYGITSPVSGNQTITPPTGNGTQFSFAIAVNLSPANINLSSIEPFVNISSVGSKDNVYISQMYVVIDYTEKTGPTITAYVKINGSWHTVSAMYVRIGGVWKTVSGLYDKIGGTWRGG